ncbi:MAG TPA: serine hydrolase domain-containing protein, partial [Saprospiraceae bacterium]|nr:serine hydrolase domain-containing protein [Saprospiraceae bacterium]
MKKIFLFNCLLLIFTNVSSQKTVIDSIFNIVDKEGFSGVILYAKDSKVKAYRSSGYKNYEKKIKIKKSDIFELASISKQFTALLIMMCKEKGLLQYDDLVEKYLKIPYKGMTLRHLLH